MPAPAVANSEAVDRTGSRQNPDASTTLVVTSLVWGALVLVIYYERLWTLIGLGPQAWNISDFHSELRATGLPYFLEAALRAISGIASAALVIAAMLASGSAVDRWLTPPSLAPHERVIVRFANGVGVLSTVLLLLALGGMYRPGVVRALVLTLAAVALAQCARAWRQRARVAAQPGLRRAAPSQVFLWAAITVLAAALSFVTALAPEIEYDALWYHLELPRRWLEAGTLVDNVHEYISLYPSAWELLFGAALAFDGTVAARLLHWSTLPAAAATAAIISTRALGAKTGWIAAVIFVTAPVVFWEATTAYVDLALAMHAGLAVCALWRSTIDDDRRWIALAGLQFGIASATKHLGLVTAAIAIGCYVVARLRRDPPARLARTVIILGLLTILVPSPWYVRAWLASGNPVFPELYAVFGATPPERWNDTNEQALAAFKAHFGRPRTVTSIATLPWDMTMHAWRYSGTLGPFLLLVLPAIVAVARRQRAARWLLGAAVLYLLVWASPISSFQLRFLVPWWVFMSALVAAGIFLLADTSARMWKPGRTLIYGLLAIVALLNLPPSIPLHERDREGWTRWLTHVVRRVPIEVVAGMTSADAYLAGQIRSYRAWQFLNEHAPADARVLTFFGGDHFYANRRRLWSDAPIARTVTWDALDGSTRDVIGGLERLEITHILVPARYPDRTEHHDRLALLQPGVLTRFPVVFKDYWTIVYRVDAASRGRGTPPSGSNPARDPRPSSDQR